MAGPRIRYDAVNRPANLAISAMLGEEYCLTGARDLEKERKAWFELVLPSILHDLLPQDLRVELPH